MANGQGNLSASRNFMRTSQTSSPTIVGGRAVQQAVNQLSTTIGVQLHKDFQSLITAIRDLKQGPPPSAWLNKQGLMWGGLNRQGMLTGGQQFSSAIAASLNTLLGTKGNGGHGASSPAAQQQQQQGGLLGGSNTQNASNIMKAVGGLLAQKGNGGRGSASAAAQAAAAGGGGGGNNNGGISGGTSSSSGQYGGKGNGGFNPQIANSIFGKASPSTGTVAASWLVHAGKSLAKFGDAKQVDQMMMELGAVGASYGTNPGQYGYSAFNYNVFGTGSKPRSEGAFSTTDALQAELARARASGGIRLDTPRDKSFDTSWRALSTANPWMSAEDSAQAIAELTAPRNQMLSLGMPEMGDLFDENHAFIGMGQFTKRFLDWTYGPNKAPQVSPREFFSGTAPGGSVTSHMNALNMSDKSRAGMIMFMEQFLTARQRGMRDPVEFENLMKSATTADDPNHDNARNKLKDYGVEVKTNLQLEKDKAAIERGFDSQHLKEFTDALRTANEQVNRGARAWKEFLDREPFKTFYSFSAWWGKFLQDPVKMLLGQQFPERGGPGSVDLNNLNSNQLSGGITQGLGGLSNLHQPGGAGPNVKPAGDKPDKGKESGGDKGAPKGSLSAVINAALSQKGVKYSWGGGNEKGPSYGIKHGSNIFGFDCSGLMQYAYYQGAGINIGDTTWDQLRSPKGRDVGWNNVQPGDLVFSTSKEHVVMWLGDGYIHAPRTGQVVQSVKGKPYSVGRIRRFLGGKDTGGVSLGDDAYDNSNKDKGDVGTASVAGGVQQLGSGGSGAARAPGTIQSDELEILYQLMGSDLAVPLNKTALARPDGENDPSPSDFIGDNSIPDPVQPGGAFSRAGLTANWLSPQQTLGVLRNDTGVGTNKGKDKPITADAGGPFKRDKGHPSTWNYAPEQQGPVDESGNKAIAQSMLRSYGWGSKAQWDALDKLWTKESHWNQYADNAISDAYGIPQSLPGTKMKSAGADWRTNPATQIKWGLGYIKGRYGNPLRAWAHSQAVGWYDTGSWEIPNDQMAVVHKGEMIIPAKKAQTIREEIIRETSSSPGPSNGWQITFGPGSVVIQLGPGATEDMASRAADKFFERLEKKVKYAQIAQGV